MLGAVCATIFILFSISYLYFFQASLLEMVQHAWSGGATSYDPVWGTGILLILLLVVAALLSRLLPLPFYYVPAMLCMGLLTAVHVSPDGSVHTSVLWIVISAVIIVALLVLGFTGRDFLRYISCTEDTGIRVSSGKAYPFLPLFWMAIFMALTFLMGNTDRSLHTRLKAEHYCKVRQWDQSLKAGLAQHDDNESITMLRAIALANQGQLPERLFRYNIPPGTTSDCLFYGDVTDVNLRRSGKGTFLLSNGYRLWQTVGFVPRNRAESVRTILERELRREKQLLDSLAAASVPGTTVSDASTSSASAATTSSTSASTSSASAATTSSTSASTSSASAATSSVSSAAATDSSSTGIRHFVKPVAKDYLLCACLIDRDLKSFMRILPQYYSVTDDLPRHYREACLLYHRLNRLDLPVDKREIAAEIADYDDFCAILKANPDPVKRNAALRDSYFGTYWYYYYSE